MDLIHENINPVNPALYGEPSSGFLGLVGSSPSLGIHNNLTEPREVREVVGGWETGKSFNASDDNE